MSYTKSYPLVTAFTLIYNTGDYVIEALNSIKANNYPKLEHIIVDDCSTDERSIQLVEKWIIENNYSCTFIKHETNKGVCSTLNEILSIAKGKYIFGCSDDIIMPERLFKQIEMLEASDDDVCAVYSKAYIIRDNKIRYDYLMGGCSEEFPPQGYVLDRLIDYNFMPAITVMVKTKCLHQMGGYDEYFAYEDYPMWLKLAEKYKFIYSEYVSGIYRYWDNSISSTIENWELTHLNMFLRLKNPSRNSIKKKVIDIGITAYKKKDVQLLQFINANKNKFQVKVAGWFWLLHKFRIPVFVGLRMIRIAQKIHRQ